MVTVAKKPNGEGALTRKDFQSDQEVRWCPGCGDYVILATMQRIMPELGIPPHKTVFVSGIGCSSRFPYYMKTYGFHTIHGRAPGFATGIKVANPELSVWLVTGDGDGLSIGGNHMAHVLRRNLDINVLLFNNRIYGLTKGQYSPTSELGKKTKSTPMGSVDHPFDPISFALGCGATFVARTSDTDPKHMGEVFKAAHAHKGTSFVEILQNCVVFNDGAWDEVASKENKATAQILLEHGKPVLFGKNKDRGIRLGGKNGLTPEIVELGKSGATESQMLVHDETDPTIPHLLAQLEWPRFPIPMGVYRRVEKPTFEAMVRGQVDAAKAKLGPGDIGKLLRSGETWQVK
ncbi:MAG: 2-oxoacid:ferredoxin oxidoreductase subunit beta [Deltaproteobacteria bacterium]|nr:2-oxoacid:ferredoxin oxidoreductase subunit beta [Deltaproteobacteria bacterium]